MRVGVIGTRKLDCRELVYSKLDTLHEYYRIKTIVSGGAIGPDTFGADWATLNGVDSLIFIPDYVKHGKSAPFKRNTDIVENSDVIVAFWDGKSSGTKDSIDKARKRGLIVKIYHVGDDHEPRTDEELPS